MLKTAWSWINERIPFSKVLYFSLDEPIVGGASFAYTLGSATLLAFIIQILSGIWQLFYYVPTVDHAYDSLNYLRTQVSFGWLIHGFHYWGASLMVILAVMHMLRVFFYGAYKPPRELTWLTGVGLLLLVMGLSFTGAPLPWDERGYWAAEVGTSIAGTLPFIGDALKRLLRGGDVMGQLALSRMFIIHVAILPGLLMALIGVHLMAFRQYGSVGPWNKAKRAKSGPFWPDQVLKDLVVAGGLMLLLIGLSAFVPPPIAGPADPTDSAYIPKPEWNFLFLYEALKFFPGKWEFLGTLGLPLLGVFLLVALPFVDRDPERNPRKRPKAIIACSILVLLVAGLTLAGFYGGTPKPSSLPPVGSLARISSSARAGASLFQSLGCIGCHSINGTGGKLGPDLSTINFKDKPRTWLITQLRNPKANDPTSIMPAFSTITDTQANQLIDYVLSVSDTTGDANTPIVPKSSPTPGINVGKDAPNNLPATGPTGPPGPAARIIGNASLGQVLFTKNCASCHGTNGQGGVANPGSTQGKVPALHPIAPSFIDTNPELFADNLDRYLQHGSMPAGQDPALHMPAFGSSYTLSQQEIADIEAYLMKLNGYDRGAIQAPGMNPRTFFYLVLLLFTILGSVLMTVSALRSHRKS